MLKLVIIFLVLALLIPSSVSAQVVINEFSSWESSGDWLELYAFEDTEISGWIVRDNANSIVETIPSGVSIGPSASLFYVVEVGNRLNRDGDIIKLLKSDDSILVDQVPYGDSGGVCAPGVGQSAGRYPDANSTIERFSAPTKATSNTSVLAPCPTPIPEPTATFTPTLKPSSTSAPTPTTRPTPTSTKTPTRDSTVLSAETNLSPTQEEEIKIDQEEKVEGKTGDNVQVSEAISGSKEKENGKSKKFPFLAGLLVLSGIGLIGLAFFPMLKARKEGYNFPNEEKS